MARRWKVTVEAQPSAKPEPELYTLKITGLAQAQVAFIRCMLQSDGADPVEDLGFKRKDGDLQMFALNVATDLEKKGY